MPLGPLPPSPVPNRRAQERERAAAEAAAAQVENGNKPEIGLTLLRDRKIVTAGAGRHCISANAGCAKYPCCFTALH
jgi:hypothetical protein